MNMDYEDIKDKIVGWLKDKENFNDKDCFCLFKDLMDDSWENVRGEGESLEDEIDEVVDPDGLEAYGEEEVNEGIDEEGIDPEEPDEDDFDEDEDDLPSFDEKPLIPPKPPINTIKKTIFAKKPRIKVNK